MSSVKDKHLKLNSNLQLWDGCPEKLPYTTSSFLLEKKKKFLAEHIFHCITPSLTLALAPHQLIIYGCSK